MLVKEIDRDNHVPLYIQIKNAIIAELDRGVLKPGDAFPSLAELSRKYKVSLITSRRVISDLASEGYLETCKGQKTLVTERNYQKMLPAGLRKNIAVTFPAPAGVSEINPVSMPWTNEILMGIQSCLKNAGFFSTLIPLGDDKAENRKVIGGCINDFDGFILFSEYDNSDIDLLENNAKAYVMIDRLNENTESNYVSADYYGGSREAADYLFELGIRSYLILLSNIRH
ncbi:MAG: GntR family transcriptional regulator, partial [Victivallaceae bacterium]|nr:GntR family transcriptional regulator [Victivallaceae bacterium]